MADRTDAVSRAPDGRPTPAAVAAVMLGVAAAVGTLWGTFYVVVMVFTSAGAEWFTVVAAVVAVVQLITAALLIVGGVRLSAGKGRGWLLTGLAFVLLLCGIHWLNAVILVAGDPDDAGVVPFFMIFPIAMAVITLGSLFLALLPTVGAFLADSRLARSAQVS